jgi:chemotaxis protein methyltransferase CheR
MTNTSQDIVISPKLLELFIGHVFKNFGISIEEKNKRVFEMKLQSLMRDEGIADPSEYYHLIVAPPISQNQKRIKSTFVDTVTVHKTNFFRENNHFEFIKRNINDIVANSPSIKATGELRVWSAAASTGEEAYTLAMVLKEHLPANMRAKILATDVSAASIQTAINGVYKFGPEDYIPASHVNRYFEAKEGFHIVSDEIKKYVTFRLLNLMDVFSFKTPFDIIFCRNVMIYFNKDTQNKLVNKFYDNLFNNSYLFIGHSESLVQLEHRFKYAEPTIYKKSE